MFVANRAFVARLLIIILIFAANGNVFAAEDFSFRQFFSQNKASDEQLYSGHLDDDLKIFYNRAAKLQRLCEGAFCEGSYLDRLSDPSVLKNSEELRPIYRFWSLFYSFMADLEKISDKYEVPLVFGHSGSVEKYFSGYVLGVSASLCRLICASEMMNFLEGRSKLAGLLNEKNSEFKFSANSLSGVIKKALRPGVLAQLYRFRISHYEELKRLLKPGVGLIKIPAEYLAGNKSVLDNLSGRVASDPAWKFLAGSFVDFSLDFILPAQKAIFSWVGDARIRQRKTRLISSTQLSKFGQMLRPGDIILGRQDWYLSNIFLPGFWPHAMIYVGSPAELKALFAADPEVIRWCRKHGAGDFVELLRDEFPGAAQAWLKPSIKDGGVCVLMEAISDGVIFNSLKGALHCDYLAAVRPRLEPIALARAVYSAFSYFGREYDFQFSFITEQTLVCTELVTKSYADSKLGLRFPMVKRLGKYGIAADSIVETFATERGNSDRQLDFVAFLKGMPHSRTAAFVDSDEFSESYKWDGGLKSSDTR